MKQYIMFVLMILFVVNGLCLANEPRTYNAAKCNLAHDEFNLDGVLEEEFWERTNVLSLKQVEINTGYWDFIENVLDKTRDVNITWQAVWVNNSIFIGIEVFDDFFCKEQYEANQNDPNGIRSQCHKIEQDDGIHLYFENEKNAANHIQNWLIINQSTELDSNYLFHNSCADSYFVQYNADPNFLARKHQENSNINFCSIIANQVWTLEICIENASNYTNNDMLWYEITYNEAGIISNNTYGREYRIAWNTRGTNSEPWDNLGKLILDKNSNTKVYHVRNAAMADISTNTPSGRVSNNSGIRAAGLLPQFTPQTIQGNYFKTERGKAFLKAQSVVIANARGAKDSSGVYKWYRWTNPKDAFISFRAITELKKRKLNILFEICDDYHSSVGKITEKNIKNIDGLILLIDRNNDGRYDSATDYNLLLSSKGDIFKYSGTSKTYNIDPSLSRYIQPKIYFGAKSDSTKWLADISVKLPNSVEIGDTIGVGLCYNDTDFDKALGNQLTWSSHALGEKKEDGFDLLGKFILTGTPLVRKKTFWEITIGPFIRLWDRLFK